MPETITVHVEPTDTIEIVMNKIARKTGFRAHRQRLKFDGHQLEDVRRLSDENIRMGSALLLDFPDCGLTKVYTAGGYEYCLCF